MRTIIVIAALALAGCRQPEAGSSEAKSLPCEPGYQVVLDHNSGKMKCEHPEPYPPRCSDAVAGERYTVPVWELGPVKASVVYSKPDGSQWEYASDGAWTQVVPPRHKVKRASGQVVDGLACAPGAVDAAGESVVCNDGVVYYSPKPSPANTTTITPPMAATMTGHFSPNRCPVCCETAEPYKRPIVNVLDYCERAGDVVACHYNAVPEGPTEKVVRCHRCNAAFWQDAEEK